MKTTNYKEIIASYMLDLNVMAAEGSYYKADYNSVYGGWRLNRFIFGSSAEQLSVLRNPERMPSKYFVYYLHGIVASLKNINSITKPF